MMISVFKMMNFVIKIQGVPGQPVSGCVFRGGAGAGVGASGGFCVLKMMNSVLKMMNFVF